MELPLVVGVHRMPLHQRLGQLAMINNWWMWGRDPVRGNHRLFKGPKAHLSTLVRERHLHLSITILGATKTLIHFRDWIFPRGLLVMGDGDSVQRLYSLLLFRGTS